ncbi:MAG: hypothetical protein JTT16_00775 [Candidatus Brockarchaeota archaeon]|nr:hypothetical protein [Candidatus Brockarchaeota archaeon]MBO3767842.1 hypothetical protein [Candidatus Brockarchaeota archaeon]
MEGGLRRSCPQQASLSACPMPTRSASPSSQADNDKCNEEKYKLFGFHPPAFAGGLPAIKVKYKTCF